MATAPRIMRIPQYPAVVAHQQWLKGERDAPVGIDADLVRFRAALMDQVFHRDVSDLFALQQYDSSDDQSEQGKASPLLAAKAFAQSGEATVKSYASRQGASVLRGASTNLAREIRNDQFVPVAFARGTEIIDDTSAEPTFRIR
jgi:hypothetical protein